jgi:hypothetical protein
MIWVVYHWAQFQFKAQLIQLISLILNFQVSVCITLGVGLANDFQFDPSVYPQGILIAKDKYVIADGSWDTAVGTIHAQIWLYYVNGMIEHFAEVQMEVSLGQFSNLWI